MADKRSGRGFQFVQPRRKIPKLDVSIVSSGQIAANNLSSSQPSSSATGYAASNRCPPQQPAANQKQPAPPPLPESENMWDDEDDDLIMRATQAVDDMLVDGDVTQMSFQQFQPNGRAPGPSSSTQHPGANNNNVQTARKPPATSNHHKDDLYTNIDTNVDLAGIECFSQQINDYMQNEQNSWMQQFAAAPSSTERESAESGASSDPSSANNGRTNAAAASAQHAINTQNMHNSRELQLKFLNAQLSQAQKNGVQLRDEVAKLNEKCQTKDGEIAMIRYDLQTHKKLQVALRQEKLTEAERIKNEYTSKLNELERLSQEQKSEIEYLKLQILNLEARQHHNMSHTSQAAATMPVQKHNGALTDSLLMSLTRLHLSTKPPIVPAFRHNPQHIQSTAVVSAQSKHRPRNVLHENVLHLQQLGAHLFAGASSDRDRIRREIVQLAEQSVDIIEQDCGRLLTVGRSTDSRKTEAIIVHSCDDDRVRAARHRLLDAGDTLLHDTGELYADEALRSGRCALAALAAIGRHDSIVCDRIFGDSAAGQNSLADRLAAVFGTIGASAKWHRYLGLVEAGAQLLHTSAAAHYRDRRRFGSWTRSMQRLLHAILVCRPGGRALHGIGALLVRTTAALEPAGNGTGYSTALVRSLCQRNPNYGVLLDAPRRIQFGAGTCSMQLYALLLQTEWPAFGLRPLAVHDGLLADVTLDTLCLVQNGCDLPVPWMVNNGVVGHATHVTGGNSSGEPPCRCYAQLVCACVVLMHQCLRQWILRPLDFDLKKIVAIAQTGVIFISDHFVMQYEKRILRTGGPAVKQRLHVLLCWFQRYKEVFLFKRSHEKALLGINYLRSNPHMFELLNNSGDSVDDAAMSSRPPSAVTAIWSNALRSIQLLRTKGDSNEDAEPVY